MSERKMGPDLSDKAWHKIDPSWQPAKAWYGFDGFQFLMPESVGDAILADHAAFHDSTDSLTLAVNAMSERLTLMTLDRDKWRELAEERA